MRFIIVVPCERASGLASAAAAPPRVDEKPWRNNERSGISLLRRYVNFKSLALSTAGLRARALGIISTEKEKKKQPAFTTKRASTSKLQRNE